jgi:hypothetical protein
MELFQIFFVIYSCFSLIKYQLLKKELKQYFYHLIIRNVKLNNDNSSTYFLTG